MGDGKGLFVGRPSVFIIHPRAMVHQLGKTHIPDSAMSLPADWMKALPLYDVDTSRREVLCVVQSRYTSESFRSRRIEQMASAPWTIVHLEKLHKVRPDQVDAALEKLLENDNDLAWSLVISAYLDEDINLGKAAELLHVHELELRARFVELGLPLRVGPGDIVEARAEVDALTSWLTQSKPSRPK